MVWSFFGMMNVLLIQHIERSSDKSMLTETRWLSFVLKLFQMCSCYWIGSSLIRQYCRIKIKMYLFV